MIPSDDKIHEQKLAEILSSLDSTGISEYDYFKKHTVMVPSRNEVVAIIKKIQALMFPDYFRIAEDKGKTQAQRADELFLMLKRQITSAYAFFDEDTVIDTESIAYSVMESLPKIKRTLMKDVIAIYEGDPAARSPEEIILSYPGFYAISIYRIAHELYVRGIPYMPRLMTEFAHEKTGIDIHAGATIGEYFFIDHGTGIVIGETTTIGNRVKIYQGVTLGAKSFELDEQGNPVKGIKRHPDIGNNVVIYANATILGGNTKIGDGVTIGGNVWLTKSVPAGQVVYYGAK